MQSVFGPTGLMKTAIPPGYALGSRTVITATGTTIYTPPSGCRVLLVECIGGGGGGGSVANASASQMTIGSGGGSGGYAATVIGVSQSPAGLTTIVSAGGISGGNGSVTSFGAIGGGAIVLCSAAAGATGGNIATGTSEVFQVGGGSGGGNSIGDVVILPTVGMPGHRVSGTVGISGAGGSTKYGAGGNARTTQGVGNAGGKFGGGGGGGLSVNAGGAAAGGHGGQGVVTVWEFY